MINMSRFQREISGQLGDFWKKNAEDEVIKAIKLANEDSIVETDGAIKWKKSGNYIPDDFCEKLEYAGYDFDRQSTSNKRDAQVANFIKNYKEQKFNFSDEEKAELDANHESGTTIVNVLTGNKYVTKK